jgi:DNA-binding CsgD family transcriptional regulator
MVDPLSLHECSASELAARFEADRRGHPYMVLRDDRSLMRIVTLEDRQRLTIGRLPGNDLMIDWDPQVSRAHLVLEELGGRWTLADDGLSRNGSFVNGARISGRQRLADGDVVRVGETLLRFCEPRASDPSTIPYRGGHGTVQLTEAQRRVLLALCRPFASAAVAAPASNREIAAELSISVEAVRTQLRALFERFEIPDLPQNQKRAELARRALESGAINPGARR